MDVTEGLRCQQLGFGDQSCILGGLIWCKPASARELGYQVDPGKAGTSSAFRRAGGGSPGVGDSHTDALAQSGRKTSNEPF